MKIVSLTLIHLHQRSLPSAVMSKKCGDLSLMQLDGHVVQGHFGPPGVFPVHLGHVHDADTRLLFRRRAVGYVAFQGFYTWWKIRNGQKVQLRVNMV